MTVVSNFGLWNSGTYIPFTCEITAVTREKNAVITTAVNHGWIVGNTIQCLVPKEYGMRQLTGIVGTVLSYTSNTVTVNIDTTNFDAFVVPTVSALTVLDPAVIMPVGDNNTGYVTANVSDPALQIPGTYRNTYP